MHYTKLSILLLLIPLITSTQKAVIIVPIANTVGQPMKTFYPNANTQAMYTEIPFCGSNDGKSGVTCPRLHQLLFNEQVDIVQEKDDEVLIEIPNAFYMSYNNNQKHQTFWTLKKYLMDIDTLDAHQVPRDKFPEPIKCTSTNSKPTQPVVTLTHPFFSRSSSQHFSAGTRFVACPAKSSSAHVSVFVFNPATYRFDTLRIPKKICVTNTSRNKATSKKMFIDLLRSWAHQTKSQIIPYVLGGCSFIDTHPAYQFSRKQSITQYNKTGTAYTYQTPPAHIANGFDCSGIILRAAQMAGIPYFCKNTSAIAATLKPLSVHDQLQAGDLIWIPGHVMVVADIKKNTIIEARGYDHGYGKVQEIPLAEQFQGLQTCQDLVDAYRNKKPIIRLNKRGDVVQTIAHYNLFTLASAWD